jgi:hypothetical protein
MFLRNVGTYRRVCTVTKPRTTHHPRRSENLKSHNFRKNLSGLLIGVVRFMTLWSHLSTSFKFISSVTERVTVAVTRLVRIRRIPHTMCCIGREGR